MAIIPYNPILAIINQGRLDRSKILDITEVHLKDTLPGALKNQADIIKSKRSKDKRLQYQASRDVMDMAGMMSSANQSIYIQQIINANQISISPVVKELLAKHSRSLEFDDVIDVQPEGGEGSGKR